jgi:hypothetical protein
MQEAMASDPSMMVDMMKKNLTGIVPQVGASQESVQHHDSWSHPFPASSRHQLCIQDYGLDVLASQCWDASGGQMKVLQAASTSRR